jgi:hypothetical protein
LSSVNCEAYPAIYRELRTLSPFLMIICPSFFLNAVKSSGAMLIFGSGRTNFMTCNHI